MIDEMNLELDKGNLEEAKAIAKNIRENLEKIHHHGNRADAIVKGMLQHSRGSADKKELTDINKLADEYLRLAFHGFRAKDKSFNAIYKTEFDESAGEINIVPQDIGRVLLNLITNAFFAVNDKKKGSTLGGFGTLQGLADYQPTVTIGTKRAASKIEITVKDNGNGISEELRSKIFQPFFTTKPSGQGTGLGLSVSYDIVKAHQGDLKVNTREGEFTEFIIQLPIKTT
jgi:signal transduction histidine kinase